MNKKYLLFVTLFVLLAAAVLGGSHLYRHYKNEANVLGKYTFAQTRKNIRRLSHIRLTTAQNGTVNLYRQGEFWHFKEAADYFINTDSLANFYNMVNNSLIMTAQPAGKKTMADARLLMPNDKNTQQTGTRIETFDGDEQLLDDVVIGAMLQEGEYRFARKADGAYIYTVSHIGTFDGHPQSWIPYPLLNIKDDMIGALVIDGKYLDRQLIDDIKPHLPFIRKLTEALNFLNYGGIAAQKDFFKTYPDIKPQTVKVLTPIGLNYVLNIYFADDTYWLTIHLQMNKIARKEVGAFVGENQKYFKDWIFQLNDEQGSALYDTQIGEQSDESAENKE